MSNKQSKTKGTSLRSSVASLEESERQLRKLFGLSEIDYLYQPIHRRTPRENWLYREELEEKLMVHLRNMERVAWILPS